MPNLNQLRDLSFQVRDACAKFNQNQLKLWPWERGHTHRHTTHTSNENNHYLHRSLPCRPTLSGDSKCQYDVSFAIIRIINWELEGYQTDTDNISFYLARNDQSHQTLLKHHVISNISIISIPKVNSFAVIQASVLFIVIHTMFSPIFFGLTTAHNSTVILLFLCLYERQYSLSVSCTRQRLQTSNFCL